MGCLKCGRDTEESQVFCKNCLAGMEKYPVRPGTVVVLPKPRPAAPRRTVKRRAPSPEEQVKSLRRQVLVLAVLLVTAVLAAVLMAIPASQNISSKHLRPGQNYSTVINTTPKTE